MANIFGRSEDGSSGEGTGGSGLDVSKELKTIIGILKNMSGIEDDIRDDTKKTRKSFMSADFYEKKREEATKVIAGQQKIMIDEQKKTRKSLADRIKESFLWEKDVKNKQDKENEKTAKKVREGNLITNKVQMITALKHFASLKKFQSETKMGTWLDRRRRRKEQAKQYKILNKTYKLHKRNFLLNMFKMLIGPLLMFSGIGLKIAAAMGPVFLEKFKDGFSFVWEKLGLQNLFDRLPDKIREPLEEFGGSIVDSIDRVVENISSFMDKMGTILTSVGSLVAAVQLWDLAGIGGYLLDISNWAGYAMGVFKKLIMSGTFLRVGLIAGTAALFFEFGKAIGNWLINTPLWKWAEEKIMKGDKEKRDRDLADYRDSAVPLAERMTAARAAVDDVEGKFTTAETRKRIKEEVIPALEAKAADLKEYKAVTDEYKELQAYADEFYWSSWISPAAQILHTARQFETNKRFLELENKKEELKKRMADFSIGTPLPPPTIIQNTTNNVTNGGGGGSGGGGGTNTVIPVVPPISSADNSFAGNNAANHGGNSGAVIP